MLETLLSAVLGAVAKLLLDWLRQKRNDATNQALGSSKSETILNKAIAEIANEQATNNAMDRGGADDVARRLRERIAAGRSANAG